MSSARERQTDLFSLRRALPTQRAAVLVGALVGVGAAPLAGCEADECASGVRRCRDNIAESCARQWDDELRSHTVWVVEECGSGYCHLPADGADGFAFCAMEAAPDPTCPESLRASQQASRCEGGTVLTWSFGYRVREETCGAGATCVDVSTPGFDAACVDQAFCSSLAGPDPLCTQGVFTTCDNGSTIVYCRCSFRLDAHPCVSPGPACEIEDNPDLEIPQGVCR